MDTILTFEIFSLYLPRMTLNDLPGTSFLQKAKFVLLIEKIKI